MFSAKHIAILAASPLFRGVAPDAVAEEVRALGGAVRRFAKGATGLLALRVDIARRKGGRPLRP